VTAHVEKLASTARSVKSCDFVKVLNYSDFEGEEQVAAEIRGHLQEGSMVVLKGYSPYRTVELKVRDIVNALCVQPSRLASVHGESYSFCFF
jgi:hypothetical protein